MIRYRNFSLHEVRERDRDAQPSPNARNMVGRFGTDGPVRTVILTVYTVWSVLDRFDREKSRDLGEFCTQRAFYR